MPFTSEDIKQLTAFLATKEDISNIKEDISNIKQDISDIKQDISDIKQDISDIKQGISGIQRQLLQLSSPEADEFAKEVTVAILIKDPHRGNYGLQGHGLLIRSTVGDATEYYLVSAAHVIVDFCPPGSKMRLGWNGELAIEHDFRVRRIYLDRRYILAGSNDIGVAMVEPIQPENLHLREKKVSCCSPEPSFRKVGQVAVGHGLIHLTGRIIHEGIDGTPRAMITGTPVPGCSGCPMFTHEEFTPTGIKVALFSFVHGGTKHRHRSFAPEDASSHIYTDKLQYGIMEFRPVVEEGNIIKALKSAEKIPEDPKTHNELYRLDQNDCPDAIREIAEHLKFPYKRDKKYSINSTMATLAVKALNDQEPPLALGGDDLGNLVVDCMVPAPCDLEEPPEHAEQFVIVRKGN